MYVCIYLGKENELRVKEQSEIVQINQNVKKGKFEVILGLIGNVTIPWCSWRKRGITRYICVCVCVYVCIYVCVSVCVSIVIYLILESYKLA